MTRLARRRQQAHTPAPQGTGTGFTRVVEATALPLPTFDGFVGHALSEAGRRTVR